MLKSISMHAEGTDIQTKIAEELALARERWPGRKIYLVLGSAQMTELKEALEAAIRSTCLRSYPCSQRFSSYRGARIAETKMSEWWDGVRALPEPEPLELFLGMPHVYVPDEEQLRRLREDAGIGAARPRIDLRMVRFQCPYCLYEQTPLEAAKFGVKSAGVIHVRCNLCKRLYSLVRDDGRGLPSGGLVLGERGGSGLTQS